MKEKVSAGEVPYRETSSGRQYLLLKSRTGDWEFPKGKVEEHEELQQAAIREVKEEAGIDVQILDGFSEMYEYTFRDRKRYMTHKKVFLFIGHVLDDNVILSKEHEDLQWKNFEQAKNTLPHSGPKRILEQAEQFLSG